MSPARCCLVALLFVCVQVAFAQTDGAIPQGTVTPYTFDQSEIFPGTVRDYWVYVPQQYDPATPAAVYVGQDGIRFNAPAVFDTLIAGGEMPVTVGVFVMHGRVKAPSDAAQDRFNRSYEYDSMNDNYVQFLLEELLPHIAEAQDLNLSTDGNDRAIGGLSSGAIAAFSAAWERPDAFSRVFSGIGTYVGLRGGDDYPTLIRKYEPKPIRVFLQDGSNDLNIYAGDWWMANQMMQRALTFAGYEVAFTWDEGEHNGDHPTQVFPEAMRWLWEGWPEPVQAGAGSPDLQEILLPGEPWELVADGFRFTEGPAVNAQGQVFFNDVVTNTTYTINDAGDVEVFLDDNHGGDGQRFGPDGRLYAVAGGANQIVAYDAEGHASVIANGFRGNDLVVQHDGHIYVTNPSWDGTGTSQIWHISPAGDKQVVDTGLQFSNGITLSPDQTLLYVADSRTRWIYTYQIQPDGTLAHKQRFFHLHVPDTATDSGVDGLRVDRDGRVYSATRMGIQVSDPLGRVRAIIPTPNGRVANVTFGGENFDILYAMCADKVYRRKLKVQGAPAFMPPTKPPTPGL
ncbi:MAG TPA: SMP-30/gluconolactonase/LRE family protein [Rhodothermales bacterium]|nr:SMP-30/gluconolactonase/LRE family protein [Rhodothermales bacterium]